VIRPPRPITGKVEFPMTGTSLPRRRKTATAARHTVGYVRVSTDDQAREGVSLAAQEERIRAFAFATGRELDEVVVDAGESAKTLNRPGLARILNELRSGTIAAVVVLKLDRLTRSVRDLSDLLDAFQKHDAALVSVSESLDTSTASGRLMLNLLASVSQWERESCGERTSLALAHKRAQGRVYGHVPFGYRREGEQLVGVPSELAALATLRDMRGAGTSLRACCAWLTSQGIAPRQGGRVWRACSVQQILESRMNRAA
jgi:site-specific DNA recombinase